MLDRLISEESLVMAKVPRELFPEGLWVDDEAPHPLKFIESLGLCGGIPGRSIQAEVLHCMLSL